MTISLFLLVALIGGVHSAPLCHDSKGLFTPCPHGVASSAPERAGRAVAPAAAGSDTPAAESDTGAPAGSTVAVIPANAARPKRIGSGRLCHDSKGLFTPCPK